MKLICLDSHPLIWGIREHAADGQEDMIYRTKAFFDECRKNNTIMMVPSIVVGELLTGIEPKHHPLIINLLHGSFQILPYDAQASALFAKLWREKKESGLVNVIKDELQATRQELKADCMIVATAIAKKAAAIYSHDKKLRNFANGNIDVREIPALQYQESLDIELV